ncbi:MAG TPA: bifunctional hydroxymethylpyrimidine kinase/phosphomethylpyrimidine kinase [Methanocorpusculum sp.]|nr:bifunctional hydroxymethylpyrimidine kinase/phosphomethylpyrimidine kinase [Methanocorpusculum sp.]
MQYPNQAFAASVAGSDPSCGAGTQVDLKTMSACGVWGLTVIAALTAQNVNRVISSEALPKQFICDEFAALEEEYPIACYKTGMLMNAETVQTVAECIPQGRSMVIDPVLISTSGFRLMDSAGEAALKEYLIPRATVVTPNIPEAEALSGTKITCAADMEKAAVWFLDAGAKSVVIKGGHAAFGRGTDLFIDADGSTFLKPEKAAPFCDIHGSGCCFASAIAAHIALGYPLKDAVCEAKKFVTGAILYSVPSPSGRRMMNPDWQSCKTFDKKY